MSDEKKPYSKELIQLGKEVGYFLLKIGCMCGICFLLFTFVFGVERCKDDAMEPAVKYSDLILYYRLDKKYIASESIMIRQEDEVQVRRVVAVAGDMVDITEQGLLVNGAFVQENEIYEETLRYTHHIDFPIEVGENQVFVLGDKRKSAEDSRVYGCVDIDDTLGKVITVIRRRNI